MKYSQECCWSCLYKSSSSPLPQANLMPTGGVNLDNAEEWIKGDSTGVGGDLTAPAKNDDYDKVTELAKQFVEKVRNARK